MDLQVLADAADGLSAMETVPEVGSPEEDYEIADSDSLDFDSWTSLISEIEKTNSDNIKAISSVYESFLSQFPLCHEYWKRYADHMTRLSTMEKAVKIFECAVESATYSVGLWVDYCSFSMLAFEDPHDVRRIFERGLSFVGKDFLSQKLWDVYIRFELSQQQWTFLAHILIRALKFPTKSLHKYYDNFKEFAAFVEEDMSCSKSRNLEPYTDDSTIEFATSDDKILNTIKKLQHSSSVEQRSKALNKLLTIGEGYYRKSCKLHEEIDYFENYMERDFFHVEPLEDEELENWHNYLDFIEKQEDFDWAVKVYERCLIPCANYPEFWMRYVEFMESKGGREIAKFALERSTRVFLKDVSEVHIFNARYREKIGDIEGARAAFQLCDTSESDSSFIETAIKEANMEKRLGNLDTALDIYKKALKMAAEKEKMHIIPILYIHFFRLKYLITSSADAAMNLLIAGVQQVPHSRLLLEELINFAMTHEGSRHLKKMDRIMATTITCESESLSSKDREDLSNLYLKFVDHCGTTNDIKKAWNRHIKSFPRLIRRPTSSHKQPRETQPSVAHSIDHFAPTSPDKNPTNQEHGVISEPKTNELQISQKSDQNTTNEAEMLEKAVSSEKEPNPIALKDSPPPATANQNSSPVTGTTSNHHETEKSSSHQQNTENPNPTKENKGIEPVEPEPHAQPVQPMVQYPVQSTEPPGLGGQNTQAYNQMCQYQYQQNHNQQQWLQMQQSYVMPPEPQRLPPQQQAYVQQQYQLYQQQEQYQQYWYQMYQQQQQQQGYINMQQYQQGQVQGMMPPNTGFDQYTQQVGPRVPINIASPTNPHQSSHGASSHPAKSARSSSLERTLHT
ncbi:pre-mRNA-processing factor 39-2 isoform X2 [Lactuca sativa]|uniref:pre-mRNA-processing factor 39-2 isoform X2 n=1 Tax=Lactuca sativa TaxID=4236 RepID=UPI000CD8F0CF|nr:pre-mRNA-processing factor 39-2 isoform X2 [Lactuca sativa]